MTCEWGRMRSPAGGAGKGAAGVEGVVSMGVGCSATGAAIADYRERSRGRRRGGCWGWGCVGVAEESSDCRELLVESFAVNARKVASN